MVYYLKSSEHERDVAEFCAGSRTQDRGASLCRRCRMPDQVEAALVRHDLVGGIAA